MKLLPRALITSALLITTLNTYAGSPNQELPATTGWSWGVNVDQLNIGKDAAYVNWVDNKAWLLGLSAEHYSSANNFTVGLGIDFVSYSDENGFKQNTNKGTKSSDASGMLLYVEAGTKLRFGATKDNFFNVKLGANTMTGSERGIGYCTNCYSEDIEIDGGVYGVLGVGHSFSSVDVALNFKQYFSGDLDNSLGIKVSTTF